MARVGSYFLGAKPSIQILKIRMCLPEIISHAAAQPLRAGGLAQITYACTAALLYPILSACMRAHGQSDAGVDVYRAYWVYACSRVG